MQRRDGGPSPDSLANGAAPTRAIETRERSAAMINQTGDPYSREEGTATPTGGRGSLTRRGFLTRAVAGVTGVALGGFLVACDSGASPGAPATGAPPASTAAPGTRAASTVAGVPGTGVLVPAAT